MPNRTQVVSLKRAAGNQKFFDPTIFQKGWRGSGRVALIAVRRQRNPRAILLAHGVGGEKSDRFSRRSEQDRRLVRPYQQTSILQLFRGNSCNENALQKILLLEKTVFSVRQKGVLPLLLPASVLQLPRCLVRICNLFHKGKQTANWQVSKSAIAAGKTDCKIEFSSQMWAARPHLGSIFEKLLHRKTFYLPAARSQHPTVLSPYITKKPP